MAGSGKFDEEFLRRLEYLNVVARKVFMGHARGERRSRKVGQGLEFSDHRNYAPGDDLRYLDWAAYGRLGRLLVRLFEEEEDLHVHLIVDASSSMALHGKLDYAAQVCAALAYVGLAKLDQVSLYSVSDTVDELATPMRGKGNIFKVFRFLSSLTPAGQTDLERGLAQFVRRAPRRGIAIVLSDFFDLKGFAAGLNLLRYHRFEAAAIQLIAPAEREPQLRGDFELYDAETGAHRSVTVSDRVLHNYHAAHQRFCDELAAYCSQTSTLYLPAHMDQPFDELVLRFFRKGGLVA